MLLTTALTLVLTAFVLTVNRASSQVVSATDSGLTQHFRRWLDANGHSSTAMARDDLPGGGGSFGGRAGDADSVGRDPVVFVHGNSDRAIGGSMGGWAKAKAYFEGKGYTSAELYATTWGPGDSSKALDQTHSFAYVSHIRNFIQAVLAYTGAAKVDIVSHSMGVTLSRKAIKGGLLDGHDLGQPLTAKVDTFVGIAGGNYGLTGCFLSPLVKACNIRDGFYPGVYNPLLLTVTGRSQYLSDLLTDSSGFEGAYRYSVWSVDDELLTLGCVVYGKVTCHFPGMTGHKKFTGLKHLEVRDACDAYFKMVTDHVV